MYQNTFLELKWTNNCFLILVCRCCFINKSVGERIVKRQRKEEADNKVGKER